MTYLDWFQHLQNCPLILAGPMLRHTTFEAVSVWVALKHACTVELTIYTTTNRGDRVGEPQMAGQATTVRVGRLLHIAVVTARPLTTSLQSDRLYAYDLRFTPEDGHPPQSLRQALGSGRPISYFSHQRPTFALPPSQIDRLQLVHGSCRKAHGEGQDTLPILDRLIEQTAASPYHRPHQLFHTGDQLYSDDVGGAMLAMCTPLGNALLGWTEALPIGPQEGDNISYHAPETLRPEERIDIATHAAGFTGGLREKRLRVASHLFSLGEFCALYLLMWSPSCWPAYLPPPHSGIDPQGTQRWRASADSLRRFSQTLWRVRRALANVPSYMIFDDHDVSDDWNLNRAWGLRVLSTPLGRRTVQNALHAYALYQGWGNQPDTFADGQPAAGLLTATEQWTRSEGGDTAAQSAIARYLGMPDYDAQSGLPYFTEAGDGLLQLDRHADAIDWHVVIRSHNHTVILLDTRLWRAFPAERSPISPPRLLSPAAFERQLREPLSQSTADNITFVVAPTNMFHIKAIDWIHHWKLRNKRVFNTDVGDAWTINMEALAELLVTLFNHRRQVVILSGDIHYSSSIRLTYRATATDLSRVLVQLTCSSLKNEDIQTRLVQSRIKTWLLPERDRHWIGWNQPQTMTELKSQPLRQLIGSSSSPEQRPDWSCHLEWLRREQLIRLGPMPTYPERPASRAATEAKRSPSRRLRWKAALQALAQRLLRWRWVQNGTEVIGVNNIGVVRIPRAQDGQPLAIAHELYWFSPWQPPELMCSRYSTDLTPTPHLAPTDTADAAAEPAARL